MNNTVHKAGGCLLVNIRNFLPSVGGTRDYLKGLFLLRIVGFFTGIKMLEFF